MDKTQGINFTLYPRHLAIIDDTSCHVLNDPRRNRSRALQHIVDEYARLTRQQSAVSDQGGNEKGESNVEE